MKIEDIKIGDKVRLLGKHGFCDNYNNIEDLHARSGGQFLISHLISACTVP